MRLAEFLERVWEVVGRQVLGAGALVALFLWTLRSTNGNGVIETEKGVVRLLTIRERARVLAGREGVDLVARRIESTPRGPV